MDNRTKEAEQLTKIFHHVFTHFDSTIKIEPVLKQWLSVVCYADVENALNNAYLRTLYVPGITDPLSIARSQLEALAPQDLPFSVQHLNGGRYAND